MTFPALQLGEITMSQESMVEEMLTAVEKELAELKQRLAVPDNHASWVERIAGTFNDVPEFDEIVRLGRDFRQSVE